MTDGILHFMTDYYFDLLQYDYINRDNVETS